MDELNGNDLWPRLMFVLGNTFTNKKEACKKWIHKISNSGDYGIYFFVTVAIKYRTSDFW